MLKYALLGLLQYQPMAGYDIKHTMSRSILYFWQAKLSQVYVTLKKLEADGLITSEIKAQDKRPDRRVYTITGAGREALNAWLVEPVTDYQEHRKDLLLLKFFLASAGGSDKATILTNLRLQRQLQQQRLETYNNDNQPNILNTMETYPHLKQTASIWLATLRFGQMYAEMYIHWLDEVIELIEAMDESIGTFQWPEEI